MIILDTNVISALIKDQVDSRIRHWVDAQRISDLWTTAITLQESRFGIMTLPLGRRRARLADAFDHFVNGLLAGRVAPLDRIGAEHAARVMADRKLAGRPGDLRDTQIAGIVLARRATLATRNTRHFDDLALPLVDPWAPA